MESSALIEDVAPWGLLTIWCMATEGLERGTKRPLEAPGTSRSVRARGGDASSPGSDSPVPTNNHLGAFGDDDLGELTRADDIG